MSKQKGFTVWFTGLSGAGKSTLAEMLFHELRVRELTSRNGAVMVVDDVRAGFRLHMGGSTQCWGVAPDLLVYFGDLAWRSVGQVGTGEIFTYENDTGPDGANHDRTGVFVMAGVPSQPTGRREGLSLVDVGPSILSLYDIEAPAGAVGRSFLS